MLASVDPVLDPCRFGFGPVLVRCRPSICPASLSRGCRTIHQVPGVSDT